MARVLLHTGWCASAFFKNIVYFVYQLSLFRFIRSFAYAGGRRLAAIWKCIYTASKRRK
jgi:hypothetical protein